MDKVNPLHFLREEWGMKEEIEFTLAISKECPRCGGPASDHPCPACEYAREIRGAIDAEIERRENGA